MCGTISASCLKGMPQTNINSYISLFLLVCMHHNYTEEYDD